MENNIKRIETDKMKAVREMMKISSEEVKNEHLDVCEEIRDRLSRLYNFLYFISTNDIHIIFLLLSTTWGGIYEFRTYAKSDYDNIERQYKWSKQFKKDKGWEDIIKSRAYIYHLYQNFTPEKIILETQDEIERVNQLVVTVLNMLDSSIEEFLVTVLDLIQKRPEGISSAEMLKVFSTVLYSNMEKEKLISKNDLEKLID